MSESKFGESFEKNLGHKDSFLNNVTDIEAVLSKVKFGGDGLVTAVAIDEKKGDILMIAHMSLESLRLTLETGYMTYWSRSRKSLWLKGESSGNRQLVKSAALDCDGDALLFKVSPEGAGAACHQGYRSCFFRELQNGEWKIQGHPLIPPSEH